MRPRDIARMIARFEDEPVYQGAPCRHGHPGQRYTVSGACVECVRGKARNASEQATMDRQARIREERESEL